MSEPKVSIVVPVYNVGKYLDCFLKKITGQKFQDFKMFVVYDSSNDCSLEVLKQYEESYPDKITIIMSPYKDGVGAARDIALDSGKINSEYVLFLDPDDYPEPEFLGKLVAAADLSGADITMCGFDRFDDVTNKVYCVEMVNNPAHIMTNLVDYDTIAYMNPVVWDKLFRRSLIENIRFTNIKRFEDLVFLMRVFTKVKSIYYVNEILYHYRVRSDSLANTIKETDCYEFFQAMSGLKNEYERDLDKIIYLPILELSAFIRCGIGITYKLSFLNMANVTNYILQTKTFLDQVFPRWRKNKYLKFSHCAKKGLKGLAVWGCSVLYQLDLFKIFITVYYFVNVKLKKQVRW